MDLIKMTQNGYDAWNRHDIDGVLAGYAEAATYSDPGAGENLTREAMGNRFKAVWLAYPDAKARLISTGDTGGGLVATQWVFHATNTGTRLLAAPSHSVELPSLGLDKNSSATKNPDFGDTFPQAAPGLVVGQNVPGAPGFPPFPGPMPTSRQLSTSRRSPTQRAFISPRSNKMVQSLPVVGAAGHSSRGITHPAEYRPNGDDALSDLAGQGGQCASADRPHERIGVSKPERATL